MTENNRPKPVDAGAQAAPPLDDNLRAGLTLLWRAWTYAQSSKADVWDFALEIDKLYETGLTITDLRWLTTKGYVEHGQETSAYGDPHRSFKLSNGLNFTDTTCFVLTLQGVEFATKALNESSLSEPT